MAQQNSFDIVSEVDRSEIVNAINQTMKEVHQRFDFKGSAAKVELDDKDLVLSAEDDTKLRNMNDILQQKLVRRGVPLKAFSYDKSEPAEVEVEFERQASSNIQVIAYIGNYLRSSGGKRVRPALTILSNYAVGGDGARYNSVRMATVMEFLHTATLVHDDIIDNASTRRNRPTINNQYGNQTAVLMGDWLYMSAFETSLAERSLPVLDILTAVTRKMTEGELLQLTLLGRTDISEEQYFDVIARKTAYLFSACCEIGALLGAADAET